MDEYAAHVRLDQRTNQEIVQTVQQHSRGCAQIAARRLERVGLARMAYLAGVLHDMGKFTREFRRYIFDAARGMARRGSVNHTFAAVRFILERFHDGADAGSMESIAAELLAYACGAHHGLFDCVDAQGKYGFDHRQNVPDYDEARDNFLRLCATGGELGKLFADVVAELGHLAEHFPDTGPAETPGQIVHAELELKYYEGSLARLLLSAVIDGDRTDTANFMRGVDEREEPHVDWNACLRAAEKYIDTLPHTALDEVRRYVAEECRRQAKAGGRLYRLCVATGAGKTLGALLFALIECALHGRERIIFATPTIAAIEQNVAAIRRALGDTVDVLEHHSNVVTPRPAADELDERELFCENWRAPVICTTQWQLLMTMFGGDATCVRRFQALCNSVIVIDEVQDVQPQMMSQFNLMVNFLTEVCGATVVLCSATQPALGCVDHRMLPAQEMVCEDAALFAKLHRTELRAPGAYRTLDEIAAWCAAQLDEVDTLLTVCNTRGEAAALFAKLRALGAPCAHISAAMCMAHRIDVIGRIRALAPGEKLVCASTSVLETGMDISFQRGARFMAGMDSIVQTAGRCNRNAENGDSPAVVQLIECSEERLPYALHPVSEGISVTRELLDHFAKSPERYDGRLDSRKAIDEYYTALYKRYNGGRMDYRIESLRTSMMKLLTLPDSVRADTAGRYQMQQAFKEAGARFTVFGEDTVDLLTPYGEGADIIKELRAADVSSAGVQQLLRRAQPYSVSVYRGQLAALIKRGAIETLDNLGIRVVKPGFYDPELGLIDDGREE